MLDAKKTCLAVAPPISTDVMTSALSMFILYSLLVSRILNHPISHVLSFLFIDLDVRGVAK